MKTNKFTELFCSLLDRSQKTASELALYLGVDQSYISKMRHGSVPGSDFLEKFCKQLNLTDDESTALIGVADEARSDLRSLRRREKAIAVLGRPEIPFLHRILLPKLSKEIKSLKKHREKTQEKEKKIFARIEDALLEIMQST